MKPLLVGEANPYGDSPRRALWPYPPRSAGARLCRNILGLGVRDYLRKFDRVNLCSREWDAKLAAETAAGLILTDQPKILMGAKVCRAFCVAFYAFTKLTPVAVRPIPSTLELVNVDCGALYIIPHPSGLNRFWNEPASIPMTRKFLAEFL